MYRDRLERAWGRQIENKLKWKAAGQNWTCEADRQMLSHMAPSCWLSYNVLFPPSPIYLSVAFSDSTPSNSCPLSCFQAWKSRWCLSLDSFLWLGIEVFMGWSAVFSQGAEPNIRFSALKLQGKKSNCINEKRVGIRLGENCFPWWKLSKAAEIHRINSQLHLHC